MDKLLHNGRLFDYYEYAKEEEFEKRIVEYSQEIFGPRAVYVDVKKRIGDEILSIPDGYLLDFSFENAPSLYIIENEIVTHDPYKHIGQQLLRFAVSYKASGRKIKRFLLSNILADPCRKALVEDAVEKSGRRNIDDLLDYMVFDREIAAVVVIDEITPSLENVVNQLAMKIDIIEFQTFVNSKEYIHKFTPFQQEIRDIKTAKSSVRAEDLDTIVVPANEDGFREVFLGENCWYRVRISSAMLERIKYIAAYQTAPISAITHYAEVARIEKYKDSGKYILHFKDEAEEIGPIKLDANRPGLAPQGPRYTTFEKLKKAKTLRDIF